VQRRWRATEIGATCSMENPRMMLGRPCGEMDDMVEELKCQSLIDHSF